MSPHTTRTFRAALATLLSAALGVAVLAGLSPAPGGASSHREAPLIAADPQVDGTDLYAFVSPENPETVTLISNWIPFQEPNGGPNFYPWAEGVHYDINIDGDGDGKADVVYRWIFANDDKRGNDTFLSNDGPVNSLTDATLLFKQTYTLQRIAGGSTTTLVSDAIAAPSNAGAASMPNYGALRDEAVRTFGTAGKTYAGPGDDPFFLDLRVFDLLYGTNLEETGIDTLSGFNVSTIALQVPKDDLALNGDAAGNPVIGTWTTAERQTLQLSPGKATPTGDFVQVSRVGNPLVNEVVVPAGLKDAFNSISPDVDHTVQPVVDRVMDPEVPKLIESIYGVPAPATPRNDLVEIFLTGICKACGPIQADLNSQMLNQDVDDSMFVPAEELRLNMSAPVTSSPNRLGVIGGDLQGFPNGRRLGDDVVDIALQAVEGAAQSGQLVEALAAGDAVDANDVAFEGSFPYLALPHVASVNEGAPAPAAGGAAPAAGSAAKASNGVNVALLVIAVLLLIAVIVVSVRRRGGPSGPTIAS